MRKMQLAAVLVSLAVVAAVAVAVLASQPISSDSAKHYTYSIVKTYSHDTGAFTEGLMYDNGSLLESTGGWGSSSLRRISLESGEVQQEHKLLDAFYGEGLTKVDSKLVQLTWLERIGFVYDAETFGLLGNFTYPTEGWGLTYDGSKLIMSDGSSILYFLDPATYEQVGQVNVTADGSPVLNINELEYVNGDVYANIWMQQKIAIINPQTGVVQGWIDLTGIYPQKGTDDVLNGIAYDQQSDRLFVTGKDWPNIYEINVVLS